MSANEQDVKKVRDNNPLLDANVSDKPPLIFTKYRKLHEHKKGENTDLRDVNLRRIGSPVNNGHESFDFNEKTKSEEPKKCTNIHDIDIDVFRVYSGGSSEKSKVKL